MVLKRLQNLRAEAFLHQPYLIDQLPYIRLKILYQLNQIVFKHLLYVVNILASFYKETTALMIFDLGSSQFLKSVSKVSKSVRCVTYFSGSINFCLID
jgi:hypothetical protein